MCKLLLSKRFKYSNISFLFFTLLLSNFTAIAQDRVFTSSVITELETDNSAFSIDENYTIKVF